MHGRNYMDDVQMYDPFWDRATWEYTLAIWPRRCDISNKRIWFKKAYKGTRMYTGPGEPVFEYKWLTKESFIIRQLRGK